MGCGRLAQAVRLESLLIASIPNGGDNSPLIPPGFHSISNRCYPRLESRARVSSMCGSPRSCVWGRPAVSGSKSGTDGLVPVLPARCQPPNRDVCARDSHWDWICAATLEAARRGSTPNCNWWFVGAEDAELNPRVSGTVTLRLLSSAACVS